MIYHIEKKTCLLIEIKVLEDSNILTEEAEKMNECKDLPIEIQRMWQTRMRVSCGG